MKTKLILLEIPEKCCLCCEDCDIEEDECKSGPVTKGEATFFRDNGPNADGKSVKLYAVVEAKP